MLVLASLFTVGPVDDAILLATAVFALALPLNLVGLFMLRLIQELKGAGFEDELVRAFREEGLVSDQLPSPANVEAALTTMRKRRAGIVLTTSSVILALSFLLTMTGLVATLWHMAWWIAVSFLVMVVVSLITVIVVMAASQPPETPA